MSVECGVLMRGRRVVVPTKFRKDLLQEKHSGHDGIVKAKELMRSYFWWPGVDKELEQYIKSCESCRQNQNNPPKLKYLPWPKSTFVYERIHIDFCGPLPNYYFLIVIDSYSKWVDVIKMKSIISTKTIECLENLFVIYGMPKLLVSDNGTSITSVEFENFV